jgi:hypothetical protein
MQAAAIVLTRSFSLSLPPTTAVPSATIGLVEMLLLRLTAPRPAGHPVRGHPQRSRFS